MSYTLIPIDVDIPALTRDPRAWLAAQAHEHALEWALIHAEDGVNWGKLHDNTLQLSNDAFPDHAPKLHARTLLRARLFGTMGELVLWRAAGQWRARLVRGLGEPNLGQKHILWGNRVEKNQNGFALLCEGSEGLRHAVPLDIASLDTRERVVLEVQRVSDVDVDQQAYIKLSWINGLTKQRFASKSLKN